MRYLVTFTVTVSGSLSAFDESAFHQALATLVATPPGHITLGLTGGSVLVAAAIAQPTLVSANALATTVGGYSLADATAALGVSVVHISTPFVISLEPPSLPPPIAPPPLSPGVIPFSAADIDHSGNVTLTELCTALWESQANCSSLAALLASRDTNGDGVLEPPEFAALIELRAPPSSPPTSPLHDGPSNQLTGSGGSASIATIIIAGGAGAALLVMLALWYQSSSGRAKTASVSTPHSRPYMKNILPKHTANDGRPFTGLSGLGGQQAAPIFKSSPVSAVGESSASLAISPRDPNQAFAEPSYK